MHRTGEGVRRPDLVPFHIFSHDSHQRVPVLNGTLLYVILGCSNWLVGLIGHRVNDRTKISNGWLLTTTIVTLLSTYSSAGSKNIKVVREHRLD
jgi:hypothetical protein